MLMLVYTGFISLTAYLCMQTLAEDCVVHAQRTGNQLSELLLLPRPHELHVDAVARVLFEDGVVHKLEEVLFKV